MIEFPCHCGFQFSVPEELAGGSMQCPQCQWLNEIPTLGDLKSILPDGTYIMDRPEPASPQRLVDTFRSFTRETHDPLGNQIDLRQSEQDLSRVGVGANEPIPLDHPLQQSPKYDPETGELIRPLKVTLREQDSPIEIPVARTAISYALPGLSYQVSPGRVYLELFRPGNAIVMSFVFLFHLMIQVMVIAISVIIPIVGLVFLVAAIMAHYGCVVEEVGREERDELPRPLRDLNIGDDVWWPFCNVMAGLILCYAPAIFLREWMSPESHSRLFLTGSLLMLGTILTPAVLLTLLTGGTLHNIRPDRVLKVISTGGTNYILLVVGWITAILVYSGGIAGLNVAVMVGLITRTAAIPKKFWIGSFLLLTFGIYLMHAFCWQLGLFYRGKHSQFPWVYQHHIRQNKRPRIERAPASR